MFERKLKLNSLSNYEFSNKELLVFDIIKKLNLQNLNFKDIGFIYRLMNLRLVKLRYKSLAEYKSNRLYLVDHNNYRVFEIIILDSNEYNLFWDIDYVKSNSFVKLSDIRELIKNIINEVYNISLTPICSIVSS